MGLFSGTRRVYVSSVAYNLAGAVADRPNYLKSVVIQSAIKDRPSIADDIINSQINGPNIDQRMFYRWARNYYPEGACQGVVSQAKTVDSAAVLSALVDAGEIPDATAAEIHTAFVDMADVAFWGERWMLENRPEDFDGTWVADFDAGTRELVISFPTGPDERVSYPDFDNTKKCLLAYYTLTVEVTTTTTPAPTPEDPEPEPVTETHEESSRHLFIYVMGSGNAALDAFDVEVAAMPEVFPVIPLRIDNKPIDHADFAEDFPQYAKAYKKAIGEEIGDILASIEENESIDDVDHAFIVHGVELNTIEREGRRYLFDFFQGLIADQRTTPLDLANWISFHLGYGTMKAARRAWAEAQTDPLNPLYGTPRPSVPRNQELELTRFEVKTSSDLRFEIHVAWLTIDEEVGSGLGKPDASYGEFWFEVMDDLDIPSVPFDLADGDGAVAGGALSRFKLFWQTDLDTYRVLTIYGMFHENFVYDGKTVIITARDALEDATESGFVVPLHYPTLVNMPLVRSTQLALSNRILIFNCYEEVRTRWYETAIFRFVFALLVAAVSAVIFPAGVGILGSNLAIGTAFGVTGTTALIVGGIANAIAAMVLVAVIETGAVTLFGDELGALIGGIASFVAVQYVGGYMNGGTMGFNLSEMLRAENILRLTNAVTGSIQNWAAARIENIQGEYEDLTEQYGQEMQEIENRRLEMLGYGQGLLNPLMFTQLDGTSSSGNSSPGSMEPESSEAFLSRTLMTGSDIVNMTTALVRNFPALSLELPKPFI